MPSRLQSVIAEYRKRLLAHERTAIASLDYAHRQTLSIIDSSLDLLYRSMTLYMQDGQPIPLEWLYENRRLQTLEQYITQQIDQFGTLAQTQVGQLQSFGAQLGQQAGMALLNSTVPPGVNFSFGMPSPLAIQGMVGATQAGSPLADLFSGFGAEAAQGAKTALISGVTLGYNPRQIAPSIQDALNISRYRALTIARTEMLRSYRDANQATFQANSDVVDGWIWQAALDRSTCAACIAMNGTEHSMDESMDSHPNCRCTMVPKTKGWDDILGPLGIDTSTIPDTSPQIESGSDWFDKQSADTQRAILGPAKYDAFQNGDFTLDDIVGRSHDKDWGSSIYERSLKDILEAAKAPKPVEAIPEAKPAPLPVFPTQKALNAADLEQFGGSQNQTFKTTMNGKEYFVKAPSDMARRQGMTVAETARMRNTQEVAAYEMGKAFHLEDALIPVKQMSYNGKDVLVSPWTEGKPLAEVKGIKQLISSMSAENYTRMHAFEYLMQDGDRHLGNYFYDGKQLRIIDLGLSFENQTKLYGRDKLYRGLASYRSDTTMDSAALRDFLSHSNEALRTLEQSGVSASAIKGFKERLSVLEALSQSGDLTEAHWSTLSKAKAQK